MTRSWQNPLILALVATALALGGGAVLTRDRENGLQARERERVGRRLSTVSASLTAQINRRQAMTAGLAAFGELHGSNPRFSEDFAIYAAGLHANDAVVRAVQVFPQRGRLLVYPVDGNEAVQQITLDDLLNDERPGLKEDLQRTIATRRITLSRPYELRQGGLGVVARQAIFHRGEFWGLAVIIINVKPLLDMAGVTLLNDLDVFLRDAHGGVFVGAPELGTQNPVSQPVLLPEGTWTISAVPRGGWGAENRQEIALFQLSSLLAALLTGALVYFIGSRVTALARTVSVQSRKLGEHEQDYRRLFEEAENARSQAEAANAESRRLLALAEQSRHALLSVVEDQKEAEAALRTSEDRYRSLVETSYDWVWEVDTQARYTFASPRVRELLGYAPEEVLGRTPFDLMTAADAESVRAKFEAIAGKRQPFAGLENVNCHRDGRHVILESSGGPIFSADGTWLGYRGFDRDITARRATEGMLRLRGLALEAAANAIVITDHTGTIDWANPAFSTLSGWSLDEVLGRNLRDFIHSDEHGPEFYHEMWRTLLEGAVWRGEIVNRRKDGSTRTEEMTVTPVRDEAGVIRHFIAIKQDITERRLMEAQFLKAQRMEAVGTLAGGIAHDLNNILAPIMMVTGLLQEKMVGEDDRELLSITQNGAQRGADIIKQLLTFSRGQSGQRLTLQPRHLLKEITVLMRETFPREIDLALDVPEQLSMVVADPTQLHQVLLNLCVNARDAMPTGGKLTVSAANESVRGADPALPPTAKPGAYVVITVSDTGHGISPEIKHRIFDPFFTTKPLGQGTGLGLPTVLGIVGSHGGFVTVDSGVNQGTAFKVYWPATSDHAETATKTTAAPARSEGKRYTLLVVDDERDIREAIRLVLDGEFDQILTATQGSDALAQYLEHRAEIRMVLTDLMMPVMDGLALIRALRVIDPKLPILAATGLNDPVKRTDIESLGVSILLQKPFDGATLLAAVRSQLQET